MSRRPTGRWLLQTLHSTAEQWTTTSTRPQWHRRSSQAVRPTQLGSGCVTMNSGLNFTLYPTSSLGPYALSSVIYWTFYMYSRRFAPSHCCVCDEYRLITPHFHHIIASLEHCWDSLFNTNRLRRTLTGFLTGSNSEPLRDLPLTLNMKLL